MNDLTDYGTSESERESEPAGIRPRRLEDFVGQKKTIEQLQVAVKAAKMQSKSLDHVLLSGPPGLGKTTLAHIIAAELGRGLHTTMAPSLQKRGDLAQLLTVLQEGDILFIDEIHRLTTIVEEVLYSAMEDHCLDLILGEGMGSRSVRIDIQPFTLIGATTRIGDLSEPLKDRFGIPIKLDFYEEGDLARIVERSAAVYDMRLDDKSHLELARRCRRTPRVANRLLRRIHDYAVTEHRLGSPLAWEYVGGVLDRLEIDSLGLTRQDCELLLAMIDKYDGGPVGLKVLSILLGENERTVEEKIEPFLIRSGLLLRTHRGRMVGRLAYEHLGLEFGPIQQNKLDRVLFQDRSSEDDPRQETLFE